MGTSMEESLTGDETAWWTLFTRMTGFPEHRRRELFHDFLTERRRVQAQSGTESYPTTSTSSDADTATNRPAALPADHRSPVNRLPVPVEILPPSHPSWRRATAGEVAAAVATLGQATGHVVSLDRQQLIARSMLEARWTAGELEAARRLIPNEPDLIREIGYGRTIAVGVFTLARERRYVRRHRLHTYTEAHEYCRKENRPFADLWETVRIDGQEKPYWRMK